MMNIYKLNIDDELYPARLRVIENAPKRIYVMGNVELLNNNIIAIVGSRNCTEYGREYAEKFASEISSAGITVVSGLAKRY